MSNPRLAISLRAVDFRRMEERLLGLEAEGIDEVHVDVIDDSSAGEHGILPDLVRAVRECCRLACHVHLQCARPDRLIERFADAGASPITIHAEAAIHTHRALDHIRGTGAKAGIAILPSTPLTKLEYLLPLADRVLVIAGGADRALPKLPQIAHERVRILRENLRYLELKAALEVEGLPDTDSVAVCHRLGADRFVLDGRLLPGPDPAGSVKPFLAALAAQRHLV